MLYFIIIIGFVSAFLVFLLVFDTITKRSSAIKRVDRYTNPLENIEQRQSRVATDSHRVDYRAGFDMLSKKLTGAKFLNGYKRRLQKQLTRGHILLKSEEYITICLILFLIGAFIAYIATGEILAALILGIVVWTIPYFYVKSCIKKRLKTLNEQLGDAVVLISNSLKAGYSFFQAIDTVCKEMKGPIAEEFGKMQREINLGLTTEYALTSLTERVGSDDLDMIITAVSIQRQVGGNLAEVLDNISETIRERVRMKGEIKTLTAQGRMSGIIIAVLPPALGIFLFVINPEHIGILFKDKLGIAILVTSAILELTGIFFINKIVKVEV